jgi:hypothetical protein
MGGAGREYSAELLALDGAIEAYAPVTDFERNGVDKIEIFLWNF